MRETLHRSGCSSGPIGVPIGATVGVLIGIIGSAVAGLGGGGAVGAGFGVRRHHQQHFTITAKDVFEIMPEFLQDGQFVYCTVQRGSVDTASCVATIGSSTNSDDGFL